MGTRGGVALAPPERAASERVRLKVLYDFEYETRGKRIKIVKDETLLLLGKTNDDWWQVVRPTDVQSNLYVPELSTFYVPTGYVTVQENPLPESTRFYVDKDKMFKHVPSIDSSRQAPPIHQHSMQEKTPVMETASKEEPRKAHESFRNVIRKLSGNLNSVDEGGKSAKTSKQSKIGKNSRKNSVGSGENANKPVSLVPTKHKDTWESSAFGMCFGRDMKNTDAQVLNPFQEELENALSHRISQKRTILDTKLGVNKNIEQTTNDKDLSSKFESIQSKWEKVSAKVLKKPDDFQPVSFTKIKEDVQKQTNMPLPVLKNQIINNTNQELSQLSSNENNFSQVNESVKELLEPMDQKIDTDSKLPSDVENISNEKFIAQESASKKDVDRLLINDKRKMWAIEMLMSELMQSSVHSKAILSSENNESLVSGPSQLAQELHEMNVSRRFENAEIQVNLLDNKDEDTKENNEINIDTQRKMDSWKKKVFDFSPRSNIIKAPKSPTARSPKLLDEYNEANILNDIDRPRKIQDIPLETSKYIESPSYSNISMRIKREKVPCKLKMPTKDFREELQLTPSLEKLASEIKFLPAGMCLSDFGNEKRSIDLDCPTTTLSQDSLRLYKRCSKSDGALNKREPRRRDSVDSANTASCASHTEIFKPKEQHLERKYEPQQRVAQQEYYYRSDCSGQTAKYKLNRKSRSLGDLDCSEMDINKSDDINSSYEMEPKRRYKPVPKLRSKESLRRIKPSVTGLSPSTSSERIGNKPIPAKRRVPPQNHQPEQSTCDGGYNDLDEIDIDRSTAIGFKALLRTSDSGSEEYLQYKTFPATVRAQQLSPYEQKLGDIQSISRSDGNVNLTRSLSDEAILSSTSCSSTSPSRFLNGSVENLNLPPGWIQTYDATAKRVCYVNDRGDKWFSSNDSEGKIYFFEENSNESSWALPTVVTDNRVRTLSNGEWPQLFDGNMCILKEGLINKTKITTENGKRLRKTWITSYAVLTELFLLFFKDAKTFAAMKMDQSATAKPDISVDLNGAFIESAEKLSNRKNVYLINTLLGLQVLIQWDNPVVIAEWYQEIRDTIQRLPFSQEYTRSSLSKE